MSVKKKVLPIRLETLESKYGLSQPFGLKNRDTVTVLDTVVGLSSSIACEALIIGCSAWIFLLHSTEACTEQKWHHQQC